MNCPLPKRKFDSVMLAHGGGGTLMDQLIQDVFRTAFDNEFLNQQNDSSVLNIPHQKLAFTTDSFVVKPLFFPGGNIGSLAVNGTVNDLAMSGAKPLYLSTGFIIEEGLPMDQLHRVVTSMAAAAKQAGVSIVTGDTKVVDKGKGDGVFINTSGIGVIEHNQIISSQSVMPGDAIIISGDVGRHGIAVLTAREGLEFETTLQSDCAPLNHIVQTLLDENIEIHCMRDLTRGGLTSALNEIAIASNHTLQVEETKIPVIEEVQGACEMLGFDPLSVANEGRFVLFVPQSMEEKTLEILHTFDDAENAAIIGCVSTESKPLVTIKSQIGAIRILDRLSGEQLPRIC
jgi:hydrogenase expression/formation protein HypE